MAQYCDTCAVLHMSNDLEECRKMGWLLPKDSQAVCEGCGHDYLKNKTPLGEPPIPTTAQAAKTKGRPLVGGGFLEKAEVTPKVVATKQAAVVADTLVTQARKEIYQRIKYGYSPRCSCHECARMKEEIEQAGV